MVYCAVPAIRFPFLQQQHNPVETMFPLVYEINTRVWLRELKEKYGKPITLGTIPEEELALFKQCRFDYVWLMGVWKPSLYSEAIARSHPCLRTSYLELLDTVSPTDVGASPYAIPEYILNPCLGEEKELDMFRKRLNDQGIMLMLDFVPNHLAVDNPLLPEHPEYFIPLSSDEHDLDPGSCIEYKRNMYLAHGKDPYFPGWTDTLQLNYANPETHELMRNNLLSVSSHCDAVRCDVAMLILKSVFDTTWGDSTGPMPEEFWQKTIQAVKSKYPGFVFLAESYWDKEWELQQLGFDYTYDKPFYDHITAHPVNISRLRQHLEAEWDYQSKLCRFLENHDEPRAAKKLGPNHPAAALILLTTPGMHLIHQGQLEGLRMKLPVQLLCKKNESAHQDLETVYTQLFNLIDNDLFTYGKIEVLQCDIHDSPGCIAYRRHLNGRSAFIFANFNSTGMLLQLDHEEFERFDPDHYHVFSTKQVHTGICRQAAGPSVRLAPHEAIIMHRNA